MLVYVVPYSDLEEGDVLSRVATMARLADRVPRIRIGQARLPLVWGVWVDFIPRGCNFDTTPTCFTTVYVATEGRPRVTPTGISDGLSEYSIDHGPSLRGHFSLPELVPWLQNPETRRG